MHTAFTCLIALLVFGAPLTWSQAEPAAPPRAPEPALSGPIAGQSPSGQALEPGLPYSEPLSPPAIVTRDRATLDLGTERERSNTITGTLGVAVGYDDNATLTGGSGASDVSYYLAPGIDLRRSTERWGWLFSYYPGVTINQRFDQRNETAHYLRLDTTYFATQHVSVRVRDTFEKTNSLFSGYLGGPQGQAPIPPLNAFVVTPLAQRTSNTGSVDLNYRFGRGSLVGAGGTYAFLNYNDVSSAAAEAPSLVDTRTFSADGFYAHRFTNNHWTGAVYNFQRFMFVPGERVDVQRALYFYSFPLRHDMSLSLWAGPEYSRTGTTNLGTATPGAGIPPRSQWSVAGGVAYLWQGRQTGLSAGYARHISDGGGLAEAVYLQEVNAQLTRRLNQRWTMGAGMFFSRTDPLYHTFTTYAQTRNWSANVGVERQITNQFAARLDYVRERLEYDYPGSPTLPTDRNQVRFSLTYSFTRPWGR